MCSCEEIILLKPEAPPQVCPYVKSQEHCGFLQNARNDFTNTFLTLIKNAWLLVGTSIVFTAYTSVFPNHSWGLINAASQLPPHLLSVQRPIRPRARFLVLQAPEVRFRPKQAPRAETRRPPPDSLEGAEVELVGVVPEEDLAAVVPVGAAGHQVQRGSRRPDDPAVLQPRVAGVEDGLDHELELGRETHRDVVPEAASARPPAAFGRSRAAGQKELSPKRLCAGILRRGGFCEPSGHVRGRRGCAVLFITEVYSLPFPLRLLPTPSGVAGGGPSQVREIRTENQDLLEQKPPLDPGSGGKRSVADRVLGKPVSQQLEKGSVRGSPQ